jgi:hypothetical protein
MVITTPMIVYRHGDDVPGERIREILVYEDCISQPDRSVENPDNSDLLQTQSVCTAQIKLQCWPAVRTRTVLPIFRFRVLIPCWPLRRRKRTALIRSIEQNIFAGVKTFSEGRARMDRERPKESRNPRENGANRHRYAGSDWQRCHQR